MNSLDATVSASQSKKTRKKPKKKASGSHLQPTHHRDASENEEKDDDAKKKRLLFEELMHELDLECAFSSFTSSLGRVMVALSASRVPFVFRYLFENVFPLFGCRVGEKM